MYRNTIDVLSKQKIMIDAGSLWKREGDLMILQDDDQYITAQFQEEYFEIDA